MSSQTPGQSPLEQAKAKANELHLKFQRDLDSLRTAPINEFGNRIDSLQDSVRLSQESDGHNIEQALKVSDSRIRDLENSLKAEQAHSQDVQNRMRAETIQANTLRMESSAREKDANAKFQKVKQASDAAELEVTTLRAETSKKGRELEEAQCQSIHFKTMFEARDEQNIQLQEKVDATEQRRRHLSTELDTAGKRVTDLRAELELVKRQPADLQERLKAVEQEKVNLQGDLKKAKDQASAAEDKLKAFHSRLTQINGDIVALVSSSKCQPNVSEPASSSALSPGQQGSVRETQDGPQQNDHCVRGRSHDPQVSISMSSEESDLLQCQSILNEIMDEDNWMLTRYFLLPLDSSAQNILAESNAKLGPMTLGTMKEKLAKGAYTSAASFKADFDLIIADCMKLNLPGSPVHFAAEWLSEIFERTWSAHRSSSHKSLDHVSQGEESRGHKRKASTERPDTSEDNATPKRVPGSSHLSQNDSQPASPAAGEDLHPALSQPGLTRLASEWRPDSGMAEWRGKITISPSFGTVFKEFDVHAKAVSLVKSPSTFEAPWVELVPTKLCVQARRMPDATNDHLWVLDFDKSSDKLIVKLAPSSHAEEAAFAHLCNDLLYKKRYAHISHGSEGYIRSFHLIPSLAQDVYPECLSGLDRSVASTLLPPDTLFLVVIFRVGLPEQRLVRMAWDKLIKAVRKSEVQAIIDARSQILHHSLPIHQLSWRRMSFTAEYVALIHELPLSPDHPDSGPHSGHFLKLSYSNINPDTPILGTVRLPSLVFALGGLMQRSRLTGLVVVDLTRKARTVWEICKRANSDNQLCDTMILLRKGFPNSWDTWHATAGGEGFNYDKGSPRRLENLGLKIERCGNAV